VKRSLRYVLSAGVAVLLLVVAGSAASADRQPAQVCTIGDAWSAFEAPLGKLIGNPCQYRLFWDGQTRTFCQGNPILGGVIAIYDYKALGVSRAAAIADLERSHDRVWVDSVEQPLMRTAYKDGESSLFGHVVYQHRAFIAELAAGEHISYWENTDPVFGVTTATVTLQVLPHTDPACVDVAD
jgi:hypothetical protein